MKHMGDMRDALAHIYTYRNMAVVALNERDRNTLLNKLKEIERQTALIRCILEEEQ